jgi:NAD(P)-dependent dehydrogenase (short-subunit alcohol dehydrogenase family)
VAVFDLFDLSGRVAVISGGSRGIGRSIALGFARAGADVIISSRKIEACQAAASDISASTGRRALGLRCHVGSWDECNALADEVYRTFDRCDVLVNCAGMSPLYPSIAEITEEYYDKVHAVNLKGPFRLSANIGSRMADGHGGSIINIGSIASLRPGSRNIVYACAKAGLDALTVGLAEAFGPKVRVNSILPGTVLTDISAAWTEEHRATAGKQTPLGRPGRPSDFVGTSLWLASDASAWVTGALIRVDGGSYRQL